MRITRREFCVEIAATAALTSPVAFAAIPAEGLKPMIKYRGGKSKEFAQYERFIPRDFSTYFEPFVGGGATFFKLAPQKAVIGDINEPLIEFYRGVRDHYDELAKELLKLQKIYEKNQKEYKAKKDASPKERVPNANEDLYYQLRNQYNGLAKATYSRAALYFFINKTAYSGMIRYNAQGHFNVPFGRYEHFNTGLITPAHSELLRRTEVLCCDYEVSFKRATEGGNWRAAA